jgi:Fur family transcriptional regulator, iron response regulator
MRKNEKRHCLAPSEIEAKLAAAGVNPTAQRIAICRYVLCEADHPTAEQVKEWADRNFPKLSLATVYNTLGTLVQAGLLKELRLPHSESVIYDDNVGTHYHFLDERTGELIDVPPEAVEVTPRLQKKFKVKDVEVLIRGTLQGS